MAKADRTAKKRSKAKPAKRKPVPRGTTKLSAKKMELRHIPWSAVELEDLNPLLKRQFVVGRDIMHAVA